MHPLSVEDLLNRGGHGLSKADYYPKHLFIRVLCHTLGSTASTSQSSEPPTGYSFTDLPRSASPQSFDEKLGMEDEIVYRNRYGDYVEPMADNLESARTTLNDPEMGARRASLLVSYQAFHRKLSLLTLWSFPLKAHRRKRAAAELTLDELKKEDRVGVQTEPMCIFLFRDGNSRPLIPFASFPLTSARLLGTVISFNSRPNLDLTKPIATRIRQRDTSLRTNADPSLLVQSLLDLGASLILQPVAMSDMVSTSCRCRSGSCRRVPYATSHARAHGSHQVQGFKR